MTTITMRLFVLINLSSTTAKPIVTENVLIYDDLNSLTLSQTSPGFYVSAAQSFENTVGKGEIARYEQFLLFPQCFLPIFGIFPPFLSSLKLSSVNFFSLEESKIC